MPRVILGRTLDETPLSVASVAAKLGVAASTLRTWERRYGMGPSARTVGSHRRYTALDIARLSHMCNLIEQGISPCDAAARVLKENLDDLQIDYQVKVSKTALKQAVCGYDAGVTRSILDSSISNDGLLKTWENLIRPVMEEIDAELEATCSGVNLQLGLRHAVMEVLRTLLCQSPLHSDCEKEREQVQALVVSDPDSVLANHVLGVALQWEGVRSAHLCLATERLAAACLTQIEEKQPAVVVVVNAKEKDTPLIERLEAETSPEIVLTGQSVLKVLSPRVSRLHSLSATVAEVATLVSHRRLGGRLE